MPPMVPPSFLQPAAPIRQQRFATFLPCSRFAALAPLRRAGRRVARVARVARVVRIAASASASSPAAEVGAGVDGGGGGGSTAARPGTTVRGAGGGALGLLRAVHLLSGALYARPHRVAAVAWTAAVVALALASTLYAVGMSVVLRLFWNAISAKDPGRFAKLMKLYCVAVVVGPIVLSAFDWCKGRLALFWRRALTARLLGDYLAPGPQPYYKITNSPVEGPVIDNTDQRLSDDIRAFTERAVRFLCVFGVACFDLLVFSIVLYKIYKPLFFLVIAYSLVGTVLISIYGRSLLGLNAAQLAREADYRFSLLRIRDSAESIAFYGGEASELNEAMRRFKSICANTVNLLGMNRNVSFFSNCHRYWIQVIPSFIVVPAYFAGNVVIGAVSQTLFAFNHVLSSLGLVVMEFSALSEFGAGVRRLERLSDAIGEAQEGPKDGTLGITTMRNSPDDSSVLVIENLSLQTPPPARRPLVQNLSLTLKLGERLLVTGESGIGKTSLLRAIAGLWTSGVGQITCPCPGDVLFLPQKPFLTLGTLRDNVIYPKDADEASLLSDEQVLATLRLVNLPTVAQRMGGLNASGEDIGRRLSLGEQQRLAFARVIIARPKLVIMDESTSALDEDNERLMYKLLADLGTTYVSVSNRASIVRQHDTRLELKTEGGWAVTPA